MGFGWLFFGYFTATLMTLNSAGAFIRVIGYAIIIFAALKLRRYHKSFNVFLAASAVMTAVSALIAASALSEGLYNALVIDSRWFSESATEIIGYLESGCSLLFNGAMLYSLWSIGKETGVEAVMGDSIRNGVFIVMYNIGTVVCALPDESVRGFVNETGLLMWTFLLYLLCIILNHILIFKCYAKICDEDDIEMERKPSRFAFVNKYRALLDEKQERARQATEQYINEKKNKQNQRRKRR